MRFSVLASGSRANCTYVESNSAKILIDCGLSGKECEKRLNRLGRSAAELDAILITHEHSDHIKGVSVLSRRYQIPVFSNGAVDDLCDKFFGYERFSTGEEFVLKDLDVRSFSVIHDASDPVGFVLKSDGFTFGQATDLGKVTPLVYDALRFLDALVLEFNHDPDLLLSTHYPWQVKQRIKSSHGHLCNFAAEDFLREIYHPHLQSVVLAHLSENSNQPELALSHARKALPVDTRTIVECGKPSSETTFHGLSKAFRDQAAA